MCNISLSFHLIHQPHTRTPKYVQTLLHIPSAVTCVNACIKRNALMIMDWYLKGAEKNHEMVLHFLIEDSKSTTTISSTCNTFTAAP